MQVDILKREEVSAIYLQHLKDFPGEQYIYILLVQFGQKSTRYHMFFPMGEPEMVDVVNFCLSFSPKHTILRGLKRAVYPGF
jgi:hypothetical protein